MNAGAKRRSLKLGGALLEVVLGIGLLAMVIPLVMSALLKSGLSSQDAKAETRSLWMVPVCVDEWRYAQAMEEDGLRAEVVMLAFDRHGGLIGPIDREAYEGGLIRIAEDEVFYVARMEADGEGLGMSLEYPSSLPAKKRSSVQFETRLK